MEGKIQTDEEHKEIFRCYFPPYFPLPFFVITVFVFVTHLHAFSSVVDWLVE